MTFSNAVPIGRTRKEFIILDKNIINEILDKYYLYIQKRKTSYITGKVTKTVLAWKKGKSSIKSKKTSLKRIIMKIKHDQQVEIKHINGNPLDLRKKSYHKLNINHSWTKRWKVYIFLECPQLISNRYKKIQLHRNAL